MGESWGAVSPWDGDAGGPARKHRGTGKGHQEPSSVRPGMHLPRPHPSDNQCYSQARPPHSLPAWWADKCVRLGSLPAGWNPSSLPTSTASFSCSCGHSACAQGDVRLSEGSLFLSPSHTPLPSGDRVLMAVQTGTSPAGAHWLFS